MKRRTLLLFSALVVMVASYFTVPVWRALSGAPATLSAQPHRPSRLEPVGPLAPTAKSTTILAITDNSTAAGLLGRPVDPTTLTDLPGFAPLVFGHHYTYAISPDGETLALITWPGSDSVGGVLHLINLHTMADTPVDLHIDDYIGDLNFSSDGTELYWAIPTRYDPGHGMPRDYQLYRYNLKDGQNKAIAQLPASFIPWSQHGSQVRS